MSDIGVSDLADEIKRSDTQELSLRLATVESIESGTCTVRVAGSTNTASGVDYVKYAPKVGDTVLVFQNGPNLIIWGIPGTTGGVPTGAIISFGSATPPPGYLLCNGQSTSGYAALAAVVGGNVPDLRDRFIVGAGGSNYVQGSTGGFDSNTSVPAHTHPGFDHTHNQAAHQHAQVVTAGLSGGFGVRTDYDSDFSGAQEFPQGVNTGFGGGLATSAAGASSTTGSTGIAAVDNRPPYYAVTYIIKT